MKLNTIADNPGATKDRIRVGRGIGSGKGKTAGRGHKGQKSRDGVAIKGFEGGQMPIFRRLPKRGFKNIFRQAYSPVNLSRLQKAIDAGKLDNKKEVDGSALAAAGIISKASDRVKLLATGNLKSELKITVNAASSAAIKAVEAAGGSVTVASPREDAAEAKA